MRRRAACAASIRGECRQVACSVSPDAIADLGKRRKHPIRGVRIRLDVRLARRQRGVKMDAIRDHRDPVDQPQRGRCGSGDGSPHSVDPRMLARPKAYRTRETEGKRKRVRSTEPHGDRGDDLEPQTRPLARGTCKNRRSRTNYSTQGLSWSCVFKSGPVARLWEKSLLPTRDNRLR
jgi:hypothetical protein